jgi:branched-chain amino acid transport system substrate-binding protein
MINAQGGINGRKIRFIKDDSSDPRTALEQTRKLVEKDKVLLMFGSFGLVLPPIDQQRDQVAWH